MSAVFTARDAGQRRHLLRALRDALDSPGMVEHVAENAYEGEDTSLYLWTFYDVGVGAGIRYGRREGHRDGVAAAVYGRDASAVADRAKARQRRKRPKRGKAKR